jgi:hypothetical protein
MDEGLARKYNRLRSLMAVNNLSAPHIQTEVADILRDLRGSGQSEADIIARTHPRRFDPDFDPEGHA